MNSYIVVYFDNQNKTMHNFHTDAENKEEALLNFYREGISLVMPINIIELN